MHKFIRSITEAALCVYLLWLPLSCGQSKSEERSEAKSAISQGRNDAPLGITVTCPVCGLEFGESESVGTAQFQGKTYHFFLEDHLLTFKRHPENFIGKDSVKNEGKRQGTAEKSGKTR